jgi:hypothetical protein
MKWEAARAAAEKTASRMCLKLDGSRIYAKITNYENIFIEVDERLRQKC